MTSIARDLAELEATAEPVHVPSSIATCPLCGRRREISSRTVRAIAAGRRDGTCPPGQGCGAAPSDDERLRRWWLEFAGVPRADVLRAGGASQYVALHGLPDPLGSLLV